jgi:hypothetical protein
MGGSTAASENDDTTGKRIFCELFPAQLRERVYTFSSVHRLDRDQHPHVRCDLNHRSALRQARSNVAQSGGVLLLQWIRSLRPRADSNSMRYSSTFWRVVPISSTNLG